MVFVEEENTIYVNLCISCKYVFEAGWIWSDLVVSFPANLHLSFSAFKMNLLCPFSVQALGYTGFVCCFVRIWKSFCFNSFSGLILLFLNLFPVSMVVCTFKRPLWNKQQCLLNSGVLFLSFFFFFAGQLYWETLCVCVCVCEREREREREILFYICVLVIWTYL